MSANDPHLWRAVVASMVVGWGVFAALVWLLPGRWGWPVVAWWVVKWWVVKWVLDKGYDAWRVRHGKRTMGQECAAWYHEMKRRRAAS